MTAAKKKGYTSFNLLNTQKKKKAQFLYLNYICFL